MISYLRTSRHFHVVANPFEPPTTLLEQSPTDILKLLKLTNSCFQCSKSVSVRLVSCLRFLTPCTSVQFSKSTYSELRAYSVSQTLLTEHHWKYRPRRCRTVTVCGAWTAHGDGTTAAGPTTWPDDSTRCSHGEPYQPETFALKDSFMRDGRNKRGRGDWLRHHCERHAR